MEEHAKRLADIQTRVGKRKSRQTIRLYHGEGNSTRMPNYAGHYIVDTSELNHIIEINEVEQYVLAEPSVELDALVEATVSRGLIPPVVMEFPGISVGGGIQGGAAESSSFKYGTFHETALEYEVVLGNGRVLHVSRDKHADLFWGMASSYGSLGIITLIKLQLIPAKPYVHLRYSRVRNLAEARTIIDKSVQKSAGIDFVDGILYSPVQGVIMTGVLVDKAEGRVATFNRAGDEWFYLHTKRIIDQHRTYEESIPLEDYLFRYDRGGFWVGAIVYDILKIPFTRLTRRLLDPAMHTRFLYKGVHKTDLSQQIFVQDMFVPRENMLPFFDYVTHKLDIWPLWLLPMKTQEERLDIFGLPREKTSYMINFGIWGKTRAATFHEFKRLNRDVENELAKYRGRKTLYAHSYYPKAAFWKIYSQTQYSRLRKKYYAEDAFDDIYQKVTVNQAYDAPLRRAFIRHFTKKMKR